MKKESVIGILLLGILCVVALFTQTNQELERKEETERVQKEVRAVYLSYIELSKYLDKPTIEEQKENISKMVQNLKSDGFNWIILHTRSFSDSIYPSKIFPSNYLITRDEKQKVELDILEEFIKQAHLQEIEIHAWINPYRIRSEVDYQTISEENPCFKWIGSNHVQTIEGKGIYYNPASLEVQNLILQGIKEIVENYDVDGIHMDDYFYPDPNKQMDLENYNTYQAEGGTLSIDKYRLNNVNMLIQKIYEIVHSNNKKMVFGIAPDGNVTNNYQENFADILTWLREDGYVDYIMPQLYYGFQNETKPYIETLNNWASYVEKENIQFIPALALYKTGTLDTYAKTGKNEWLEHSNIIASQIQIARNHKKYAGFSLFRYDYLYEKQNEITEQEKVEIKKLLRSNR